MIIGLVRILGIRHNWRHTLGGFGAQFVALSMHLEDEGCPFTPKQQDITHYGQQCR